MITITDEKLINLAGQTTFDRGVKLYQSDAVTSIKKLKNHILATVSGTKRYTVDLTINQQHIEGACSCPASDYMDFCKHCVAVALTLKTEQEITSQVKQSNHKYAPIEPYLATLSKQQLQTELSKIILNDSELKTQWLAKAEVSLGLLDYKTLRKKITAAIPYNRHLYRYDAVRTYFFKVENLAQQLIDTEESFTAEEQFKLAEYALQRLDKALETIDDSGGFRLESQTFFSESLLNAFKNLNWTTSKKANWLLDLTQSNPDIFPDTTKNFWPLLSSKEQATLAQQIQKLWDEQPKPNPDDYTQQSYMQSLQAILVEYATSQQQFATVIQLHEKTANRFHEYKKILHMEVSYGFFDEAETRLSQLRERFTEHQETKELHQVEASLAKAQQQYERMLNALWQHYTFSHELSHLQELIALAKQHNDSTDWIEKAEQLLLSQASQPPPPQVWLWQPYTRLAELYLTYGQVAKALQLTHQHKISDNLVLKIIRSPDLALMDVWPTYQNCIENQLNLSNNEAYKQAIQFMREVLNRTTSESEQEEVKQWMLECRERFKIKRNFAQWFDEFWA